MKTVQTRDIPDQTVRIPGSKSISHRMLMAAALAKGTSRIENLLCSRDITWTSQALSRMGATLTDAGPDVRLIEGCNGRPVPVADPIYLENSGTSLRLLAGIAALGTTPYILTGNPRLCQRPMGELLSALHHIGIRGVSLNSSGTPPVTITGGSRQGGTTFLDCSRSSQYLSALLMIGPFLEHGLHIHLTTPLVSRPYSDLTLAVMARFGVTATRVDERYYQVPGGQHYTAGSHRVEPDLSNAGYFWAAAAITGRKIGVANISEDSLQGDFRQVHILEKMGCCLESGSGCVAVQGGALSGITVDMSDTPDAVPAIAVVAAFARGTTRIARIGHLREKECDRIHAVASQLTRMGIAVTQGEDWIEITGGTPRGARIDTFDDHRIAMAFAIAGLRVPGMEIENETCVEKSFPGFWEVLDAL